MKPNPLAAPPPLLLLPPFLHCTSPLLLMEDVGCDDWRLLTKADEDDDDDTEAAPNDNRHNNNNNRNDTLSHITVCDVCEGRGDGGWVSLYTYHPLSFILISYAYGKWRNCLTLD